MEPILKFPYSPFQKSLNTIPYLIIFIYLRYVSKTLENVRVLRQWPDLDHLNIVKNMEISTAVVI
jgi:hypothetical protein